MGVSGKHVLTFAEANFGTAVDVHMNGDYEFFYDVLKVTGSSVRVRGHKSRKETLHRIKKKASGREYFEVVHRGAMVECFGPERVAVMPFRGDRI